MRDASEDEIQTMLEYYDGLMHEWWEARIKDVMNAVDWKRVQETPQ